MKKEINVFDYANEILTALPKGVLVVTEAEDFVNAMTIGWGTLGVEWGKQIFAIYVRESRFTYDLLLRNPEFTVAVPYGDKYASIAKKAIGICGSKSGRDADKISVAKLTPVDAEIVRPPALKELPLTLECKVVFSQRQPVKEIDRQFNNFYPLTDGEADEHTAYYGEIVKSYIIED